LKLTPEFLQLKFIEAIANNTKIFFGDKVIASSTSYAIIRLTFFTDLTFQLGLQVPNMILDQRLLGNLLHEDSIGTTATGKSDI